MAGVPDGERTNHRVLLSPVWRGRHRSFGLRRLWLSNLPPLRFAARTGRRFGHWLAGKGCGGSLKAVKDSAAELRFARGSLGALVLASFVLACCSSAPPPKPATGAAYAGPPALNLRGDLGTKSQVAATAKHGDRLEVLEIRRRSVRVRTVAGVEGWTDVNNLLSEQQMDDLRLLAASAAKLPAQGSAKVYEPLNVHAEPYRQSPSFFQIPEGAKVEVVAHRTSPHAPPPQPKHIPVHRTATPKKSRSKPAPPLLMPLPAPPGPPPNWMELSKSHAPPPASKSPSTPPPPEDDWDLVRTPNGEAGWALARMLVMDVPEEVAQYAEGHRVTAYLPLGDVQDKTKNEVKQNWLWTTASAGLNPYDFDSFRVFVWSFKRHHYETAYIERNVKGYYPIQTEARPGEDEKAFSVVLEDKDGQLYKRTFGFNGYHIRMISKTPYQRPAPLPEVRATSSFETEAPAAAPEPSLSARLTQWWKGIRGKSR